MNQQEDRLVLILKEHALRRVRQILLTQLSRFHWLALSLLRLQNVSFDAAHSHPKAVLLVLRMPAGNAEWAQMRAHAVDVQLLQHVILPEFVLYLLDLFHEGDPSLWHHVHRDGLHLLLIIRHVHLLSFFGPEFRLRRHRLSNGAAISARRLAVAGVREQIRTCMAP